MAKYFKDFTYLGRKLSELNGHYVSVDFEQNPDIAFAFSRDTDYGDTNRYRIEPNTAASSLNDHLTFELHIVKDPDTLISQDDAILTDTDIRELTRWLTSTSSSQYLCFEYEEDAANTTPYYYGQFSDIRPFSINGDVCGLKLIFECSTPYGYTGELTDTLTLNGSMVSYTLMNQDDRLNDYCYPSLLLESEVTGDVCFCNLSDCKVHMHGTLNVSSSQGALMEQLKANVDDYCLLHAYSPKYPTTDEGTPITFCGGTVITCTLTSPDSSRMKCTAFYRPDTLEYYLIQGGFFRLKLKKSLPVSINSEKLFIFDDLNRMVKLSDLGVADMDYMYWPRLQNGSNTLLFWGENCRVTITHRETRKAGA